jgi:hypothetical protein
VLLGLIIVCCMQLANNVSANIAKAPTGTTVSPAFQQVQINSTETTHLLEFNVTNNSPSSETLKFSAADFNALNDSGGLFFVGTNPTQQQKQYGLASWLSLSQTTATIGPKQTVKITASITNDPSLSPGGHYGALMLALATGNTDGSKKNRVSVHPIASSLLFVNKTGGDIHKLKLTDVSFSHNLFTLPSSITLRFYNNGNTHLIPRGTVTLTSPSGKVISRGIINEDSNLILPQVYRRYSVQLNKVSSAIKPGNYKLSVNFRFDGYDQFRSYQTKVFLLAPTGLMAILIILAVLAGCTFYLFNNHKATIYFSKLYKRFKNKR